MKQLIAILVLTFTLHQSQAQSVYYASQATKGSWNSYSQKYVWGTPNSVSIRFTIQGDIVLVGDRSNSTYTTSHQTLNRANNDGSHEYAWQATDERGVSCIFKMINYSDGSKLMFVFYSDYAYMYTFNN